MLIRFRVENYRSISEGQELSFVAAPLTEFPEKLIHSPQLEVDLLRVVGIYGANASGKSTLLNALKFMRTAVLDSHSNWKPKAPIPHQPFLLNSKSSIAPSLFEADFLIDNIRYTYGFILNSVSVLEEWLSAYPQGKKQKWFVRRAAESEEFVFSRLLQGENKAVQTLTRNNSLFLSTAAQNNHLKLTPIFEWFDKALVFIDDRAHLDRATAKQCLTPGFLRGITEIMKSADLGITGIDIEEEELSDDILRLIERVYEGKPGEAKEMMRAFQPINAFLRHRVGADGSNVRFPFSDESRGTQALFGLAGAIVTRLADGGLLCVDELDASLHPLMAVEIVKMFNDPKSNPNNAQLLFNTHDTNILEYGDLRRDQVWFTEKDTTGATHLYSLTDYKARKEENIKRGYLQGRYGAIPFIRTPATLISDEQDGQSKHP
jgi:AAA15 family ATPase/GTPase